MKTVFLSSTSKDLSEYRAAVIEAIEGIDGYHCDRMEEFGARDDKSENFCPERVAECDLFVGILGPLYGSSPSNSDKSYTEQEYDTAVELKKPRLMFVTPPVFPLRSDLIETDDIREKQRAFRERVDEDRIRVDFSLPDDLATKVTQAIHNWAAKNIPEEMELPKPTPEPEETTLGQYESKSPTRLFTGREEEKADLAKRVEECRVCMITGIGGTGKTELVAKYISEQTKYDENSVFWFDLHQGHTVDDIAVALEKEEMLKGEKMPAQQKGASLSHAIELRSCLIVIDNIQETSDESMDHLLRHACDHFKNSRIILIGKSKPTIVTSLEPNLSVREIEGLKDDGLTYAKTLKNEWKVNVPEADLQTICTEVQNHPLAIEISLQILRREVIPNDLIKSIIDYSKRYNQEDLTERLLSELHKHTSQEQRDFAYRLSVFKKPVPKAAIQYLYIGEDFDSDLWKLQDGLMLHFEDGLYSMHSLVSRVCYDKLANKTEAHNQATDYYSSQRRANKEISLEAEIIHHLVCAERLSDAHKILIDYGEDFLIQGHTTALFAALAEIQSKNDLPPQLRLLKGKLYERLSRYDEAQVEFTAAKRAGDPTVACESKYWLSIDLLRRGLTADALILAEDGLSNANELTPIFRAPDKGGNAYLCPAQTARRFVYAAVCTTRAQYAAS